jgi:uncharacterized tellurite resistance protein B-like protein
MFKTLFDDIMGRISAEDAAADDRDAAIRMATAVLMVDVALVDSSFEEVEFERMLGLVKNHFGLSTQAAAELINAANAEADELVSVHEFTELLHQHLDDDEKARVVELLWSTAYADGELNEYENSLVLKVSDLLNVDLDVAMRLKLKAR